MIRQNATKGAPLGAPTSPAVGTEPFLTLPDAAKRLGIPYSTVLCAANAGLIPVYRPFGARMRVRLSEVVAAIEAAQVGGAAR